MIENKASRLASKQKGVIRFPYMFSACLSYAQRDKLLKYCLDNKESQVGVIRRALDLLFEKEGTE